MLSIKHMGLVSILALKRLKFLVFIVDYLTIQYQNNDTISIPVDQVELLTKYTAGEGKPPKINKLNDGRWKRTVNSVSKQIEDILENLIKLYAIRESQRGFAFLPDDDNQHEFDDAFAYTESMTNSVQSLKLKKTWNVSVQWIVY